MKFIRTKDGRILDFNRIKLYAKSYSFNNESETHLSIEWDIIREEIDILKQADTIEELCDGFIIGETLKIYNKSNFNFERKIVNLGHKEYMKFENLKSIYAVIMTFENGIPRIITVAKMNEKGELELL